MLVSIIIPVYNVSQYIETCLLSVINQTYKNIEIIIVNDCTPDNSMEVLEKYTSNNKNIKIIHHKKNSGLSAARNTGIENASGEYIYFLDSDDWIHPQTIEVLLSYAIDKKASIVTCNIIDEFERYSKNQQGATIATNLDNISAIEQMYYGTLLKNCACDKLYLRSLFIQNNIRFPEGVYWEDVSTVFELLINSDKVFISNKYFYHYRKREASITTSKPTKKHIYDYIILLERLYKRIMSLSEDEIKKILPAYKFFAQSIMCYIVFKPIAYNIFNNKELPELFTSVKSIEQEQKIFPNYTIKSIVWKAATTKSFIKNRLLHSIAKKLLLLKYS